ncbi:MAG: hypothetical protein KDD39_08730 [Bdellovibrionales bacterium]|nr:hypothetical protein [Bdellovibrionales bacterium]
MKKPSKQSITEAIQRLENHCRTRDFAGYSKFDALNSPLMETVFGGSALGRLLVTQLVNRVPLPLRRWLGVRKSRNPKGIANFIKGYCLSNSSAPSPQALAQVTTLSDWLLANTSKAHGAYQGKGTAWGYNFPWQSPGFFAPRHYPNCIVTIFCGDALLNAYLQTRQPRYLEAALGAADFITQALPVLDSTERHLCIGYVTAPLRWRVININAVSAGFLAKLGVHANRPELIGQAKRMVAWVIDARNPDYSWNYTSPKNQSGIGPDNYHTGGILDGIADYMLASRDFTVQETYERGLSYYADKFFTAEHAPKWRAHRDYPQDIHGAAQGILTFCKAETIRPGNLSFARNILEWTLTNLAGPEGNFYYQKHKLFTWKLELMRWSNSWMFWAMNTYQAELQKLLRPKEKIYDPSLSSTSEVEANL